MCPWNETEIEYNSPTPSDKTGRRLGSRTLAAPADAKPSLSAEFRSDGSPSVAPHEDRGAGSLRAARPATVSWTQPRDAAKRPLARLDDIAARLNTALVIVALVLAYADLAVYLGVKVMALDLDWATILQAYAIVPTGMV